uniref:CDP-diacylglycerol--glycerol-3-phosphate 3-phosphatidyltransferase n=1 Tax=Rhabditophanes sp. KR3021 TaxID=114890 RepID=A0AC35UIL4_9BILA
MKGLWSELRGVGVKSSSIEILQEPKDFYNTLINLANEAKERISLSTLYLGTGELEKKLVTSISNNKCNNDKLQINILLDYLRGTRGIENSVSTLEQIHGKANIFLYHTPDLRGLKKSILPQRANEIIGLQHMKFYVFDNSVIISGANLSNDYFTNRQDRYILISDCPELADFFSDLLEAVGTCSFYVDEDSSTKLHEQCLFHPFDGNPVSYKRMFYERIVGIHNKMSVINSVKDKTVNIYPLLQMGTYGINDFDSYLVKMFGQVGTESDLTIASGYFNLTNKYSSILTRITDSKINIITSSPEANGFYTAKGLSKHIPAMYVQISKKFFNESKDNVSIYEFKKPEWTFHGKGIWCEKKNDDEMITIAGSSNFGERSVSRDLESQLVFVTYDEEMKKRFNDEKDSMIKNCNRIDKDTFYDPDHVVPYWVTLISKGFRHFF